MYKQDGAGGGLQDLILYTKQKTKSEQAGE